MPVLTTFHPIQPYAVMLSAVMPDSYVTYWVKSRLSCWAKAANGVVGSLTVCTPESGRGAVSRSRKRFVPSASASALGAARSGGEEPFAPGANIRRDDPETSRLPAKAICAVCRADEKLVTDVSLVLVSRTRTKQPLSQTNSMKCRCRERSWPGEYRIFPK